MNSEAELKHQLVLLEMVKDNWKNIMFMKHPNEDVQLAAIKEEGEALKYIKNPSFKVQYEAVKNHGDAILYIENPSEDIMLESVKNDIFSIRFIEYPSESVQLVVVNNLDYLEFNDFMDIVFDKINNPKALNFLYKISPKKYKKQIKSHQNYKGDAQLVLESIK